MAKALCQHFLSARLIQNAVDPPNSSFRDRGIWQLTPKGLCILQDFYARTEADISMLRQHFGHLDPVQLIWIRRAPEDDHMVLNRQNAAAIFRMMMHSLSLDGQPQKTAADNNNTDPTLSSRRESIASSTASSVSSDGSFQAPFSLSSASSVTSGPSSSLLHSPCLQLLENRLLITANHARHQQRPTSSKGPQLRLIFSAQLCCDWLTENCTLANRDEAEHIATEFLRQGWIGFQDPRHVAPEIQASKSVLLVVTDKGKQVTTESDNPYRYVLERKKSHSSRSRDPFERRTSTAMDHSPPTSPESNSARLQAILDDPALRSLFKDFLRSNFCEENLDFWIDYSTLRRKCRPAQYLLEDAYSIWATYLAPGAPCELNIEHTLRREMARVIQSVVQAVPSSSSNKVIISTHSTSHSLHMILKWFDRVNEHIFRLMASDSVPKFVRTDDYRKLMADRAQQQSFISPNMQETVA